MKILGKQGTSSKTENEAEFVPTENHGHDRSVYRNKKLVGFAIWGFVISALLLLTISISMISWSGIVYLSTDDNNMMMTTTISTTSSHQLVDSTTISTDFTNDESTTEQLLMTTDNSVSSTTSAVTSPSTSAPIKNMTANETLVKLTHEENGQLTTMINDCKRCAPTGCGVSNPQNPKGHNVTLSLFNVPIQRDKQLERENSSFSVFVVTHNENLGIQQVSLMALEKYFVHDDTQLHEIINSTSTLMGLSLNWFNPETNFTCNSNTLD